MPIKALGCSLRHKLTSTLISMANYDIMTYWSYHGMWQRRPVVPNISLLAVPESCLLSQSCSWNLQCVTQSFRLCSLQSFCWEMSFHCCSKSILYGNFYWRLTQFPASHKHPIPQQLWDLLYGINLSSGLSRAQEHVCVLMHSQGQHSIPSHWAHI